MQQKPSRTPWEASFPPVYFHILGGQVGAHPCLRAARCGDVDAAALLVADSCAGQVVDQLAALGAGRQPLLAAVHAQQAGGLNVLPEVLAQALHLLLGWDTDTELVQVNVLDHAGEPGEPGVAQLARQALFAGSVAPGRACLIVDDAVGPGGTIANLRGHILRQGALVLGATALAGDASSATLRPPPSLLRELRDKHGPIENWWHDFFGFGFDCLTACEADCLVSNADSGYVRARIEETGGA